MISPENDNLHAIAIVGMAGRFPGANDVGEFWKNLAAGKDCITRFSDEQLAAAGYDPKVLRTLPNYIAARGVVEKPEWFDRGFFGVPPKEAEAMDPQHRIFLEVAWEALEDAGCDPSRYPGLTGVFAGMSINTYYPFFVRQNRDLMDALGVISAIIANEKDFLTTRLAYKLNLRGPALNIQTACSSALVSVCVACQNLLTHQCDIALAGGVSLTFPQTRGYFFQDGSMTSADGWCRPFDARANGTVFSSGAGVVVLKRLADALADGDRIYAVVKGHALNNDGSKKVSFAAPSVDGQTDVIALAQAVAGVSPETISYIEAHGTATALGDPIEIAGLTQVFREATDKKQFCALGSVKGNIGHCDAASGITSLIKTALAFHHEKIPPSLNCEQINPALHLEETPFFINTELRDWPRDVSEKSPRRAGVSSFGVGGTNAHIVLEEAPLLPATSASNRAQVLVLSAKTAGALEKRALDLATHLESHGDESLADVAFTLQTGRQIFQHRRVIVARTHADAVAALRAPAKLSRVDDRLDTPVALLFPGQGAQYAGMGAQLYSSEPVFRASLDECAEILRDEIGCDLREILFSKEANAEARLRETRFTQPAIFAMDFALGKLWLSLGAQPVALLGHSVGEFAAAALAGIFSLEDAARLVATRARLVHEQPGGAMLAARLTENEAREFCSDRVDIAAINSPKLCVLSGPFDAIEKIEALFAERRIVARRLSTSHAFHSPMVEPVIAPLADAIRSVKLNAPSLPIVSSVTGKWMTAKQATDPNYWTQHLRATVRFADAITFLLGQKECALIEAGPRQTLAQLARQSPAKTARHEIAHTLDESADERESLATALSRTSLAGVALDWRAVHSNEIRRRVSLPSYPFERQRYFADLPSGIPMPLATAATDGEAPVDACAASAPVARQSTNENRIAETAASSPAAVVGNDAILGQIKQLFTELSGVDLANVPATTNLLELGFDSLFLTQIALTLRKKFALKMTFRQLMEDLSSLDKLAEYIAKNSALVAKSSVEISPKKLSALESKIEIVAPEPKRFGPFKPIETGVRGALTVRQQKHLDALIARYTKRAPESKRQTQANRAHFADPRSAAGFNRAWKEMVFPIVVERASGARMWDVDGNEYVDVTMGFGTNLLGHEPQFIADALAAQLKLGIEVGPQTPLAGKVARLICDFTGMERVAFCNTGSEAVMAAMRIARTVTGRARIATTGGFHGINDEVLVRSAVIDGQRRSVPVAPGIPEHIVKDVLVLDWGSPESLEILKTQVHEMAAVLVEPVQSRRLDFQPVEFLRELRKITRDAETPLIFDEVITGFRCHPGGAQALWGIRADIATYGKIIGGGMPIGAVAGSATYMDALDGGAWQYGDDSYPEVGVTFFAGTYIRHPLTMAASWAMLNHLKQQGPQLQQRLNERAAELTKTLNDFLAERGVPVHIQNFTSILYFHFDDAIKFGSLLYFYLREKGLHVWEGRPFFLSTAHTEADVAFIVRVFQESVIEMQDGGFLPAAENVAGEKIELTPPAANLPATAKTEATITSKPASTQVLQPAKRGAMQFSLYYFGSYPAAYDPDKYKIILEGAKFADQHGFTAVWLPERHFHSVGGFSPNPSVIAAALARETQRVQLRGGSVVLPLHHPVRVAEEWSVVDNLSNGRVGISIASGWHPNDFVLAPDAFENRRELCSEGVEIIKKLWHGESVNFSTAAGTDFAVKLHPMPKQENLPLWLTCIHPDSFVKAGEMGVGVLSYVMNQSVDELAEKIRLYRESLAKHGHDPASGHVTVLLLTFVGENLASARSRARGPMREYLRSYLDNKQKKLESAGGAVEIDRDDVEFLLDRAFDDYAQGRALIGTPESCAPIVEKFSAIGVDEIGCFIDFGVKQDAVLENLEHLDALRARFEKEKSAFEIPLTESEAGLSIFSSIGENASRAYNDSSTLILRGELDVEALQRAFQVMVDRHEALRTVVGGESQRVLPVAQIDVPFVDFSQSDESQLATHLAERERAVFDFNKPPMIRAAILKTAADHHLLALTFHHLLGNGPSYAAFVHELFASYEALRRGETPRLEPAMQLSDFVAWQNAQDAQDSGAEKFWLEQFSSVPPVLDLPSDRARPAMQTFTGGRASLTIDKALVSALKQAAAKRHCSLFMMLFSAYAVLLHRLSGQDDVVVGVPFEGEVRSLDGGHSLYANTTHMLPLRSRIADETKFSEYLTSQKQRVLDASEHQNYFFGRLIKKLNLHRDPSRSPLFSTTFNFENGDFHKSLPGLEVIATFDKYPHRGPAGTSTFELALNIAGRDGGLICQLDHADFFDDATAQRWIGHFKTLLESIAANPNRPVSELSLLDDAERHRILVEWNDTRADYPSDVCLHELIEAQVARTPDAVAVVFENERLTYRELNRRANRLAHALRGFGVGPETLAAICVERSVEMVVGLLAILKSGGAYVPLDPNYPQERLAFMLADASAPVLLTQKHLLARLPKNPARTICLDAFGGTNDENPASGAQPENIAYVIYTSGSTGKPKGAMNTHRGICNRLLWMQEAYRLDAADSVLQKTPFTFDVSVWEFFWPLMTGARLVVAKPDLQGESGYLIKTIREQSITTLHFVPPMLGAFLTDKQAAACDSLKRVICSGEALPTETQRQFFQTFSDTELHNLYGPTEASVDVTAWACKRDDTARTVPIGRPVANTQIYILDRAMQPVPVGVAGELHIGGVQVARGYLGRPNLTAEKFVSDPFSNDPDARLHKKGGFARFHADASIAFQGRIEPAEIESALKQQPDVLDATVVLREDVPGSKRLVAYVVAKNGALSQTNLSAALKKLLPDYMVPSAIVTLPALPKLPNGKPDRQLQPVPVGGDSVASGRFNRPERTAEKFTAHPFEAGARLYKTGDLARWMRDGSIAFVGRADQQVKIRGFRIEPAEIEAALGQHPAVRECAVVAREDGGGRRLIACIVAAGDAPGTHELRQFLKERIPDYMIPSAFVFLEKLPLTPSGKINRRALPPPGFDAGGGAQTFVAPRTPKEAALARIWEQLLGRQPIGVEDDFFEIGGHSLLAMRLFMRMRETFGKSLPLATLFRAPTVSALAALLDSGATAGTASTLVALQPHGHEPPLFCIHGGDGGTIIYRDLSENFGADRPLYALESPLLTGDQIHETVEEMAAFYIGQIQAVQPSGPYHLAGFSLGGTVAFEMAQQLRVRGAEVGVVTLFDGYNPACLPRRLNLFERIAMNRRLASGMGFSEILRLLAKRAMGKVRGTFGREKDRAQKFIARLLNRAEVKLPAKLRVARGRESSVRAWMNYSPQPYAGPVLLFVADDPPDGYEYKQDRGWSRFAENLELFRIKGAFHETMLYSPHVSAVVRKLHETLADTDGNNSQKKQAAGGSVS